jgi:hypothetical protein
VSGGQPYADANWNGIDDGFEQAHGITASGDVNTRWSFDDLEVINDAGYDAFEMYSAWVAGDFDRLAQ